MSDNDEARMTDDEGNPNAQMTNDGAATACHSDFVIPSSFVLRTSSFFPS
jgi:hypothetical protein